MITLATLHKATEQEVFDQVKDHLLKQGEQSFADGIGCAYRGDNGMKCAAGCLIADDEYNKYMEGSTWKDLNFIDHQKLISRLQDIHDHYDPEAWEDALMELAEQKGLKYTTEEYKMKVIDCGLSVFCEDDTTVTVTVETQDMTESFHVQTHEGKYRSDLGCWILTDNSYGEIDQEDYPTVDFDVVVSTAQDYLSKERQIIMKTNANAYQQAIKENGYTIVDGVKYAIWEQPQIDNHQDKVVYKAIAITIDDLDSDGNFDPMFDSYKLIAWDCDDWYYRDASADDWPGDWVNDAYIIGWKL